jgi:hypothetical protein
VWKVEQLRLGSTAAAVKATMAHQQPAMVGKSRASLRNTSRAMQFLSPAAWQRLQKQQVQAANYAATDASWHSPLLPAWPGVFKTAAWSKAQLQLGDWLAGVLGCTPVVTCMCKSMGAQMAT